MATDIPTAQGHSEDSAASLIVGVLDDLEQLMKQQLQLVGAQIESGLSERLSLISTLIGGFGLILTALIVSSLGMAHLLFWWFAPQTTDSSALPLWGCHFIVAGTVGSVGILIVRRCQGQLVQTVSEVATTKTTGPIE